MITKIDIDNDAVSGRLGNKLFQIAAAYSIAKHNNDEYRMPPWKYLTHFPNVKCGTIPPIEKIYSEPTFNYSPIPYSHLNGVVSLNGYFQSDKYFSSREDILELFKFGQSIESFLKNYKYQNYTSIHVRRGDYTNLTHFYHDLSTTDYYRNAITDCCEKKFVVFSDDIEFCKTYFSQFQGCEFIYSEDTNEIQDLILMTTCKNNIIANSSFSWWGAYLNKNGGKVYMPKDWFSGSLNSKDLEVKGWIVI